MSYDYQLVVIGSGSGGKDAAILGARAGLRVLLVEKESLGGTCFHRGVYAMRALHACAMNLRGCLKSPDSRQILSSMCSLQLPESWDEAYTTFCELGIGRTFQTSSRSLLNPPAIPGLTESLTALSPAEWRTLLSRLRRARLLAVEDPDHPGGLDAHPLVREFFGEQLRSRRTAAWQEGNRRLYDHCRAEPHMFGLH